MNRFDVIVYTIRRRRGRHRPFEVRWKAAGRVRSKSFITRALADSYRAELVRAARKGRLPLLRCTAPRRSRRPPPRRLPAPRDRVGTAHPDRRRAVGGGMPLATLVLFGLGCRS